ncbi:MULTISPECIES: hypothetical protein [unclassified Streptomyces]|uniref:hypothetical protein n=1 Tax=unclassified Streptomyces TaxID=2593676 RepID=UPI00109E718E|nr:hypothetical protein [Streptomyces sp. A1136]THA47000.1 hypothetical protein E6R62_32305 [Streptomyces sp. A1136]
MSKVITPRRTAAVLAVLASTALLGTGNASASLISQDGARIAAYQNSLKSSTEEGAADALRDFDALGHDKQVKFLNYAEDPENLKALLEEVADVPTDGTPSHSLVNLKNGDVQIAGDSEATFTPDAGDLSGVSAAGKLHAGWWDTTYTVRQKIFGITITKLSVWVNYHTNGSKIDKVDHADCGKRNFNGAVSIGHGVPKAQLADGNAIGQVVWEGSIIYKGFGVEIDKRQQVVANAYGFKSGYLKNI